MELNERLRKYRKDAGLTQIELAEEAGIAVNSLRLYEAGKITPKFETLEKIAAALGVSWLDLIPKEVLNANTVEAFAAKSKENDALANDVVQHFPQKVLDMTHQLIDTAKKNIRPEIQQICEIMQVMNEEGQRVAVERVEELAQIPKYQRQPAGDTAQDVPDTEPNTDSTQK